MRDHVGVAVENRRVAEGLWRLVLKIEDGFSKPLPGQFVNLRLGEGTDPLLRRPFSIYSFSEGPPCLLGILYAPVGRWTRRLASSGPGVEVSVLGPLGTAFSPGDERNSILVAGGRGVAPLIYLSKTLAAAGRKFVSLIGARGEGDLYWDGAMDRGEVKITTDDGSAGAQGMVTDLLDAQLAECAGGAAVYCCGPVKMLRKVSEICRAHGRPCQASVETVFACGVGVCRGCTVPRPAGDAPYLMACSDGPVMRAEDVNWERFAP